MQTAAAPSNLPTKLADNDTVVDRVPLEAYMDLVADFERLGQKHEDLKFRHATALRAAAQLTHRGNRWYRRFQISFSANLLTVALVVVFVLIPGIAGLFE